MWSRGVRSELSVRHDPRWFFTNESSDVLALCSGSLDRLGIAHRFPRPDTISIARKEAVAALDALIGPEA